MFSSFHLAEMGLSGPVLEWRAVPCIVFDCEETRKQMRLFPLSLSKRWIGLNHFTKSGRTTRSDDGHPPGEDHSCSGRMQSFVFENREGNGVFCVTISSEPVTGRVRTKD
jgi:hypothetical protein